MPTGTQVFADALVAVFADDGTVVDVIEPYIIRGDRSLAAQGRLMIPDNNIRLAWVDGTGRDTSTVGIWLRYVRASDFVLGGPDDPAALAATAREAEAAAESG